MKQTTEIKFKIFKLEALKRSADNNIKRISKTIQSGKETKNDPDRWIKLSKQYQEEINQLKTS